MPPTRTKGKQQQNAESSSSNNSNKNTQIKRHHHHPPQPKADALPGRQKIKAALRQAHRFLAKDKVPADKRVETERRIKALEAELEQVEQAQKERTLALRYHKVKFFERQKVTRKLKQLKKRLESASGSEKDEVAAQLAEERVNLNYILHYPKTKKYISLFPPEVRKGEVPDAAHKADAEKTNQEREEIRGWIRESMKKKELPSEPELHLDSRANVSGKKYPTKAAGKGAATTAPAEEQNDIEADDFFANDGSSSESEED